MFNIVIHQPEIPHNTGAIGRTCLMTGCALHLIHPLGFFLNEKNLRRAGLDYWHKITVNEYMNFSDFLEKNSDANLYIAESGDGSFYSDVKYTPGDFIMFGSETVGVPRDILERYSDRIIKIPMIGEERSLNLSVSVGIVLYEALRQNGFLGLM